MKSQIDLIKSASVAYLVDLNPRGNSTRRYAVYLEVPKEKALCVLWPEHYENGKHEKLLPHQTFSKRTQYPAYHFRITGYGFNKDLEMQIMLRQVNPNIKVYGLFGAMSESVGY